MTQTIKPRTQHVIVECNKKEITPGGIIIPDKAQKKEDSKWFCIAVGEEVKDIKPGDQLLFDSRSTICLGEIGFPDNWFVILAENIIGVIE